MSAEQLIERIRAARQRAVTVGGHAYTIRRPTDAEAIELSESDGLTLIRRFVVGWDLAEIDLVPGGGPEPAPFDPALWAEWVADQPDVWAPLAIAIRAAYHDHAKAREDAAKN